MDFVWRIFDTDGFPPRWQCGVGWSEDPALGWGHILSDLTTTLAYLLIPCVLAFYVLRKRDVSFPRVFWLFCAFILACGIVHLLEAITFWSPVYRLSAVFKIVTAVTSAATVIALVKVAPIALTLPGLAEVNKRLTREIEERRTAQQNLLAVNAELTATLESAESAEARLRDAEAKLRGVFDNTRSFIGLMTKDGTLIDANRSSLAAAGIPPDAVLNKPFWEAPWWSHSEELQERLQQAISVAAAGTGDGFVATHPVDDGGMIDLDFNLSPVCSDSGEVLYLVPEGRDISALKNQERELKSALGHLEQTQRDLRVTQFATDNASDEVFFANKDGAFSYVNRKACDDLGYSQEELLAMNVWDINPGFSSDLWDEYWKRIAEEKAITFECRHQRKDGSLYNCEVSLHFLEFDTTRFVHGIVRDTTSENTLRKTAKASEQQMRLTFEASPSGLLIANESGEITMVNAQMSEMFGYQADEMLGKSIDMLIPASRRDHHRTHHAGYQTNRTERAMGVGVDLLGLRKDGTEIPLEIGLTPIDGALGSTMATINDISERKQYQEFIEQKNEHLSQLNSELQEFAYSTSHDLKAPLASITGLLNFCESDLNEGEVEEVLANLGKAKRLAKRLANRVESILVLAKSDMQAGDWKPFPVLQRVNEIWDLLPHEGVSLDTSIAHKEPFMSVDVCFDAILANLLSNAVKYQNPDQKEKTVRVSTWTRDEEFYLSVQDNGVGIPEAYHEKVFRLFHRLAGSDIAGTGVGLTLVKKSTLRLGGDIEIKSDDGMTDFIVRLPQSKQIAQNQRETK